MLIEREREGTRESERHRVKSNVRETNWIIVNMHIRSSFKRLDHTHAYYCDYCWPPSHPIVHTHTYIEREREQQRQQQHMGAAETQSAQAHKHIYTHTHTHGALLVQFHAVNHITNDPNVLDKLKRAENQTEKIVSHKKKSRRRSRHCVAGGGAIALLLIWWTKKNKRKKISLFISAKQFSIKLKW